MSSEPQLSNDELAAIADQLRDQCEVYTRRDVLKAAGVTGSVGVLAALGIDPAAADHDEGGQFSNLSHIETNEHSGPVPAPDAGARRMYAESDGFKQIDSNGNVSDFGGLSDGENFDGQGSSQFSNLQSLDAESLLNSTYPSNVRAISAGEVVAEVDPADTATPVQDAIDAVNNDGDGTGRIAVPNGIETPGGWTNFAKMHIEGYGPETVVNHTDDTNPAILVDSTSNARECYFNNLVFDGPGASAGETYGIEFTDHTPQFDLGHVRFRSYNSGSNGVINCVSGSPWMSTWRFIRFSDIDGVGMRALDGRPLNRIGIIESYLNTVDRVVQIGAGHWQIGGINVGGSADVALFANQNPSYTVECGYINFEPKGSIGGSRIAMLGDGGRTVLGHVRNNQDVGSTDGVTLYQSGANNENANKYILSPVYDHFGTLNNPVDILDEPTGESWYYGPASDINNSAGSSTGLVRSMATAGTGNG